MRFNSHFAFAQFLARMRFAAKDVGGSAAIEFAIVANLFLMLVVGIISYALYVGTEISVQQLAADSARASVAGLSNTERTQLAQQQANLHVKDYVLLDPARLTVKTDVPDNDPNQFVVSVEFDASSLPIWAFSHLIPLPGKTIVRSASIKNGGY